jgi:serine/threonine protein kinase/Flp pilus assembly protein TadD
MHLHAGARLGPYEILDSLGAGGMGEVYRARDSRIGREVAVKILPEAYRLDRDRLHRFEQEARSAGALDHPNLVSIHDVGTHEGTPYIVMELLKGETLREKMSHPIAPRKAIDYAAQIASGLAAAHQEGIVHRDLKPENIVITRDGRVKILDFGLAKLRGSHEPLDSAAETAHRDTRTGTILGTASYMSPEQVRGADTDARSDIFALGTILHEMLSGSSPFHRASGADTMSAILRDDPPSIPASVQLHPALQRVVHRCLEKSPEERFQSARDLAFALREIEDELRAAVSSPALEVRAPRGRVPLLLASLGVAVVVIVSLLVLRRPPSSDLPAQTPLAEPSRRNMIIVLPFENLGDPADSFFAAGVTEEITSRLASVRDLGVISRTTAVEYNRKGKTLKQLGQDLGVDYVLEGTVRWDRSGDQVRVTPQLIRVADDTHLWAERYDRKLEKIFEVQSNIAEEVIRQLNVTLRGHERSAITAKPTDNTEAYEAFLRAQSMSGYEIRSARSAIALLERAVRLDPQFAVAHAVLGLRNGAMYHHGFDRTPACLDKAKRSIEQALAIDPQLPQAHNALGFYYYWGFLDYDRALREFALARESRPNDAWLLESIAFVHRRQGRFQTALQEQLEVQRMDPWNPFMWLELANTYRHLRRYPEADQALSQAVAISPDEANFYRDRIDNLWIWKGATSESRKLLEQMPDTGDEYAVLAKYEQNFLERRFDAALEALRSSDIALIHNVPLANEQAYLPKALLLGQLYAHLGDSVAARQSFHEARLIVEKAAREQPENARIHSALGLTYARLERKADAIREGELAVKMYPLSKDAVSGPQRLTDLATIYAWVGEKEKAIALLEKLLSIPSHISAPILRHDPTWDPLRGHSKFEALR